MTTTISPTKQMQLTHALEAIVAQADHLTGAAVIGLDGVVYSTSLPNDITDEVLVGAATAGLLGISEREALELHQGHVKRAIIQCDEGDILVYQLNGTAAFVALTDTNTPCDVLPEMPAIVTQLEASL